jgi:hypothetical protein
MNPGNSVSRVFLWAAAKSRTPLAVRVSAKEPFMTFRCCRFFAWCVAALILNSGMGWASLEETPDETQEISMTSAKKNSSSTSEDVQHQSRMSLHYFGIFFGPALQKGSDRPSLDTRSYITLNSTVAKDTVIGVTGGWSWQGIPSGEISPRDPFLKISRANIVHSGNFSWYGDFRVHLPITAESHANDLWVGLQSFHYLGWEPGAAGTGLSLSARYNQFGGEGQGDEWELYAAPSAFWNVLPRLAFNLLLEWGAGRPFRDASNLLLSNGLDLEPGLNWRLSDGLTINPYLSLPLDQTSRDLYGGASLGMTMSWQLL